MLKGTETAINLDDFTQPADQSAPLGDADSQGPSAATEQTATAADVAGRAAAAPLAQLRAPAVPQDDLAAATAPQKSPPHPADPQEEVRELAAGALDELQQDLRAGKSETLERFLLTMGKFHNYSFNNVLLIAHQRPDAAHVAGFTTWKKLGRYVNKGEKGIRILAPLVYKAKDGAAADSAENEDSARRLRGFRVVRVFDVSQTSGKPLPEFAGIEGDPGKRLARLREIVKNHDIELEYAAIPGGADGVSRGGSITIRRGLSAAEDFSVLVHEFAHELLHKSDRRAETTTTQRETEAEAVAFVVSRTIGLATGTRSSDYLQLYGADSESIAPSLDLIQNTASRILRELLPAKGKKK
ncbi:ArdC family protein [Pirellulales bacterium]|nr:ArdC family protein [Pirellulales bacterium]